MSTDMLSYLTESQEDSDDLTFRVCGNCHHFERIDERRGKCKKKAPSVLDGYVDAHSLTALGFWPGVRCEEKACGEYRRGWDES